VPTTAGGSRPAGAIARPPSPEGGQPIQIAVVHGPDRLPVGEGSAFVPFHGIISRSLAERLSISEWNSVAAAIESTPLGREVLAYGDSMAIAEQYVRSHRAELESLSGLPAIARWELWSCKEGHTASIWRVTAFPQGASPPVHFCLNIARDTASGVELEATAEILHRLGQRHPAAVVRVLDRRVLDLARTGLRVPVIATDWIDGWELHALPKDDGPGRLVAVARFLFSEDDPMAIRRVAGFPVEPAKSWGRILHHWIRFADWSGGPVMLPTFEVQEGDWIFDGEDVTLCAASAKTLTLDPGAAVWACILLHAAHPQGPIHWGDAAMAIAILKNAQSPARPALAEGLKSASTLELAQMERLGLVTDSRAAGTVAAGRRQLDRSL
jgi:hypothetical protein